MKTVILEVSDRNGSLGRGALNRMRAEGRLPAVIYGPQTGTVPITVSKRDLLNILNTNGLNAILTLKVKNKSVQAMIKEIQTHPVTGHYTHIDFSEVSMNKKIRTEVAVNFTGEPKGLAAGGIIQYGDPAVEIECLPGNIPENLAMDISDLAIGDKLSVGSLVVNEQIKIISEPQQILISVIPPVLEEDEEEQAEHAGNVTEEEKPEAAE
ncbi:MAG: 50S ribosomal protein L25 [Peptococcaceae bacterium]